MRFSAITIAALMAAGAAWPPLAAAQNVQDFIFTDDEGHLVVRYAGAVAGSLDASQLDDVHNAQLSTMVHDRLAADVAFAAEPIDTQWAESMAPQIEKYLRESAPEFSAVDVQCRSAACRLVLAHASTWRVAEHQALMGVAQGVIEAFMAGNPGSFEPVFLIVGRYQEPDRPYTKVFLRRAQRERP